MDGVSKAVEQYDSREPSPIADFRAHSWNFGVLTKKCGPEKLHIDEVDGGIAISADDKIAAVVGTVHNLFTTLATDQDGLIDQGDRKAILALVADFTSKASQNSDLPRVVQSYFRTVSEFISDHGNDYERLAQAYQTIPDEYAMYKKPFDTLASSCRVFGAINAMSCRKS